VFFCIEKTVFLSSKETYAFFRCARLGDDIMTETKKRSPQGIRRPFSCTIRCQQQPQLPEQPLFALALPQPQPKSQLLKRIIAMRMMTQMLLLQRKFIFVPPFLCCIPYYASGRILVNCFFSFLELLL